MNERTVIGVVAGLVLGGVVGWFAGSVGTTDREAAAAELATVEGERDAVADEKAAAMTELETTKLRASRVDRELNDMRAALASAKAQADVAQAAVAAAVEEESAETDPERTPGLGEGQVFSFPEYDEYLAAMNWTEVGEHFGAMAPLLAEIFDAIAQGGQPSPEAIGSLQQHNGPLVTVAMKLHGKLPGETVNGALTHPSAAVNIIVSTLKSMGKPLSKEQVAALDRVGNDFVSEDRRRVEAYADDALTLRRQADESLLKGRFYDAAMATLTDEQHALLRPEATRGRVTADLFSAALVWAGRARPVPFKDRADLGEILAERMGRELGVEGEARDRLTATLADWAAGLPDELMTREPDVLWLKGLVPLDAIDLAAEQQIVLMNRLLVEVDLSEEAIGDLRGHNGVFVPTWRPEN